MAFSKIEEYRKCILNKFETAVEESIFQYALLLYITEFDIVPLNLSLLQLFPPVYERRFFKVPALHLSSWKLAFEPPTAFLYDVQPESNANNGLLLSVNP